MSTTTARYTAEEIEEMKTEAGLAECTAPSMFWCGDPEHLTTVCNGVGSESMPQWARDVLTWIYRNYAAAAAIHDCRYELSDGTDNNRADADEEFQDNCFRLWKKRYGVFRWLRPAAYAGRAKIKTAYLALKECGDEAWQEAYQKNKLNPEFVECTL